MEIENAIRVLEIEEREQYKSTDEIIHACSMARFALKKLVQLSPYSDDDPFTMKCGCCGSSNFLFNNDWQENSFCGQCGQKILWPLN